MTARTLKWPHRLFLMTAAVFMITGCGSGNSTHKGGHHHAVAAQVMALTHRTLTLNRSYPAKLRSAATVKVVARIKGFLRKRYYTVGSRVSKGQKLYSIEPAPYKAQLEQKKANLASAKATLYKARRSWKRISTLYQRHVVSRQKRDNAKAGLDTAKASVKQAKAALAQARINYGYTQVTAPVAGMASLSRVNPGNLVQPGEQLATITPLTPIQARFSMPPRDAAALRAQRRQHQRPQVSAMLKTRAGKKVTGRVDFLGSRISRKTSTVQARATFNNPHAVFLPGQFVRVTLQHLRLPHVLAVPQVAVTEGQQGPQIYILGKHNKVSPKNVDLGAQTPGHWIIIKSGAKAGTRVVVNHVAAIKPGMKVKPQPFKGEGPNAPAGKAQSGKVQSTSRGAG